LNVFDKLIQLNQLQLLSRWVLATRKHNFYMQRLWCIWSYHSSNPGDWRKWKQCYHFRNNTSLTKSINKL